MTPLDDGRRVPLVWCPIIPLDEIEEFSDYERELENIANIFDDWSASMRGKSIKGGEIGIYLDRIRILMINIGIGSGTNRDFAENVQSIITNALRKQTLRSVESIWEDSGEKRILKDMLRLFFNEIRFTRDIDPLEEMEKIGVRVSASAPPKVLGSKRKSVARRPEPEITIEDKEIRTALVEATRIVLNSYLKLLSPDPWSLE